MLHDQRQSSLPVVNKYDSQKMMIWDRDKNNIKIYIFSVRVWNEQTKKYDLRLQFKTLHPKPLSFVFELLFLVFVFDPTTH